MNCLTRCARLAVFFLMAVCACSRFAFAAEERRTLQYLESSGLEGQPPNYESQVMILDGAVVRSSLRNAQGEEVVEILDARNGRRVLLYPKNREFIVVKGRKIQTLQPDAARIDPIKPDPAANLNRWLRRPDVTPDLGRLPEETVDGVAARRFVIEEQYVQRPSNVRRTRTTTTWVEPVTKLPVKIEIRDVNVSAKEPDSVITQRNIVFNEPLEASLFSTEPPAGYVVLPEREF